MGRGEKIVSEDFGGGLQIGGSYIALLHPIQSKSKFKNWGNLLDVNLRVSSAVGRLSASVVDKTTRSEPRN